MKTLILFELRKNQKGILLLALITGAMIFFSMLFYPTISENLNLLGDFLTTGFMQGIMGAFNVDVFAMKTLMGFFSTYTTMWVVLLGSIFFAYLGSEWIAKEEKTGTIEFLLSKPLTRSHIFISKAIALSVSCIVFISVIGVVGLLSMGIQYKSAPYDIYMKYYHPNVAKILVENNQKLIPLLTFTEEDFKAFTMSLIMSQYTESEDQIKASGVDVDRIMANLKSDLNDPEALFEKMVSDPEGYMTLLGIENMSPDAFKASIQKESRDYAALKETFMKGQETLPKLFALNPTFFLNHIAKSDNSDLIDAAVSHELTRSGLMGKLDLQGYGLILMKMLLVVWVNGLLGLSFAAVTKDAATSSQKIMVVILLFYFMNSLSDMTEATKWLKYLTPFGYVDGSLILDYKPLILLTVVIGLLGESLRQYRVKDFL